MCPSSQRRSVSWPFFFWPCCLSSSLGIGLLRRPRSDAFHLGVFMRWSSTHGELASGSSRSQASRYGLLVSIQGASDSMPHSSPEGEVVASGFCHSGTGVAPGNVPSSWHGCLPGARSVFVRLYLFRPPDAEALSWLGGLGAGSWTLMLGSGVFLPDLGAQLLVYPN